jgi:hypothetical protein
MTCGICHAAAVPACVVKLCMDWLQSSSIIHSPFSIPYPVISHFAACDLHTTVSRQLRVMLLIKWLTLSLLRLCVHLRLRTLLLFCLDALNCRDADNHGQGARRHAQQEMQFTY